MNGAGVVFNNAIYTDGIMGIVDKTRIGFGRLQIILFFISILLTIVGIIGSIIGGIASVESFKSYKRESFVNSYQGLHTSRVKSNINRGLNNDM